jgi:ubiquinone/menaquinone biosynthesis C-methylase UbiE
LYQQVGLNYKCRVLEVGCGTGVITTELNQITKIPSTGIDLQFDRLALAKKQSSANHYYCADVYNLPFKANDFDFVVAHYLFLWLRNPVHALIEIRRVLKPGGVVIALAEPDYLARIDNPQELWRLGELQTNALIQQGVNPMAGRQLSEQIVQAGFGEIQNGISGFQENAVDIPFWFESEWKILKHDLAPLASIEEIEHFREQDLAARQRGARISWVPTFYALGKK